MRFVLVLALAALSACDANNSAGGNEGSAVSDKELQAGDVAPDVELTLHTGDKVKLSSLMGSKVLLWFYPMDDTPG